MGTLAKIEAAIANARAAADMHAAGPALADLVWAHHPPNRPAPRSWAEVAPSTPESAALARELKRRGFRFCRPDDGLRDDAGGRRGQRPPRRLLRARRGRGATCRRMTAPVSGGRSGCAALAATRGPGHEPHDDDDGHGDQTDDEKRLERCNDAAHRRDGKRYGDDRADDCPDDPAHVPSMRPGALGRLRSCRPVPDAAVGSTASA